MEIIKKGTPDGFLYGLRQGSVVIIEPKYSSREELVKDEFFVNYNKKNERNLGENDTQVSR